MKPITLFLSLLITCFFIARLHGQTYTGDTWAEALKSKQGTVALVYVETPGFVYKDSNGQLTGICVDIMKDFALYVNKTKGVKLNAKFVGNGSSFRGMYNNVKASQGGVFSLGNVTITAARKKEISFSSPFITNYAILITPNSVPTLSRLEEVATKFSNLMAYTVKGTTNEKRLLDLKKTYYPDLKISYLSSSTVVLEKILQDPRSFTYLDVAFYLDAIQHGKPVKRHGVGDQSSEQFGLIMPLGSDWQPVLNEFFEANGGYVNSIAYKKILSRHLGDTGVKLITASRK